ncbi:LuxR C-terminal-related transcriptional regulator [Qipengyuania sp. G39]|uniref:LuxR C-terminal-related transcriptional regulator n=1 Tax=Qipengyuania profundimaris TaxID=3067652 RepID=A0ABT9HRT2_9SPHN|nr:LuxR C-terminal-related transcriptional regulator [Qipengyuania sp. G39]MDP4575858.1 LuxR C-terminal-related transcriptional regulator [Qipengyuania sp. G39]
MEQRQTLHIVGGSSRSRAEQAHLGYKLGHHCEIYANVGELIEHVPDSGMILAFDDPAEGGVSRVLRALSVIGKWLPVVATSFDPRPTCVVEAIKAGALDYLRLPLKEDRLGSAIARIAGEADAYAHARRKMVEARNRIAVLSPREREVLDWLAEGCSNKMIARELSISPRTVEIHRANMMTKLGAEHPSQAVRLKLEAQLEQASQVAVG